MPVCTTLRLNLVPALRLRGGVDIIDSLNCPRRASSATKRLRFARKMGGKYGHDARSATRDTSKSTRNRARVARCEYEPRLPVYTDCHTRTRSRIRAYFYASIVRTSPCTRTRTYVSSRTSTPHTRIPTRSEHRRSLLSNRHHYLGSCRSFSSTPYDVRTHTRRTLMNFAATSLDKAKSCTAYRGVQSLLALPFARDVGQSTDQARGPSPSSLPDPALR